MVLYGPKSKYSSLGYERDKNRRKLQVEFMVAQLAEMSIPIYIKLYKGNASDEKQYRDCVPELAGLMSRKGIHALDGMKETVTAPEDEDMIFTIAAVTLLGAAIVANNGAASERNTTRIRSCGMSYVTIVELNKSDLKNIDEHLSEFTYVSEGVFCYKHTFKSSGRTTYLFLSRDLLEKWRHNAWKCLQKDLRTYEEARNGKLRKSDYIKMSKVPGINVDITLTLQGYLLPFSTLDKMRMVRERMGPKCGFFKLQSDVDMTPEEALRRYCRRAGVEHLISSLKRITGIKPIRVWKLDSVDGSMVLALLSEAAIAMARCSLEGRGVTEVDGDGKKHTRAVKPSTEAIFVSLTHLTLTWFREGKGAYRMVISNYNPISTDVFDRIREHESPRLGLSEDVRNVCKLLTTTSRTKLLGHKTN